MTRYEAQLTRVLSGLLMERRLARVSMGGRIRRRGGPPLLELVEPDAAAGREMLERLRHHFGGRGALPVNDLRVPTDADNTSGRGVVDCLWHLSTRAGGLGCELSHRPPLTFPRLSTGLLVRHWADRNWHHLDREPGLDDQLRLLMKELQRDRADQQPGPEAGLYRVEQALSQLGPPGVLASLGLALPRLVRLKRRPDRVALHWWGRVLGVPHRTVQARREAVVTELFRVNRDGRDRHGNTVESLLTRAFLADLDAYYTRYRRLNRDRPPLILLPQAHTPTGRALLDALAGAYETAAVGGRRPTRPVVLALSTTHRAAGSERRVDDLAGDLDSWTSSAGRSPAERWLLTLTCANTPDGDGR
ncbi:hypothetical protein [Streptomyces sp. NPDC058045]|uniref:hypothetical protein n=1 Tax=Streptomyces sp. NPDC058045 TaxID=3346311 RepID=UPI0036E0A262